jgi:tetratricopeptide (TPR) repeat protein
LANIALSFDDQLDEVYQAKGLYYWLKGPMEEALVNLDIALKINPNSYNAYFIKGAILTNFEYNFVKGFDCYRKALNLVHGNDRPPILRMVGLSYLNVGFIDKAKYYYNEALTLDGDSVNYFRFLAYLEFCIENFENAILIDEKASKIDSTFIPDINYLSFAGHYQGAYMIAEKYIQLLKKSEGLPYAYSHRIGYAFWKMGKYKEAEYYFNEQIRIGTESIKLGRIDAIQKTVYYDLAGVYAFLGNTVKAYQCLDEFNTLNYYPLWLITYAKYDPLFDSIRNEERFQKILQNMEAKYQAEHEGVRKWLEEQGML